MDGLVQTGPKAYINVDRLNHNFSLIQNHAENCSIMCIVKANGYGHGGVIVSQALEKACLLYTSPSPRDRQKSRMPSSA